MKTSLRTTVRFPNGAIPRQLKARAKAARRSVNSEILALIEWALAASVKRSKIPTQFMGGVDE